MPKIEFRGQTYNNEYEMPYDVRQAYLRVKEERTPGSQQSEKSLSDVVDMPADVKAIYERALGSVDEKITSSRPSKDLPDSDEIYRQSAPENMKHLPSDESIYRPSDPLVGSTKPAIEPEPALGGSRLISSILWALILVAIAFLVIRFLL